jgi:hypothetical protein
MALIANERVYMGLLKMFNFLIEVMPSFREALFYREVSHELTENHEEWESKYEKEKMTLKQLGNRQTKQALPKPELSAPKWLCKYSLNIIDLWYQLLYSPYHDQRWFKRFSQFLTLTETVKLLCENNKSFKSLSCFTLINTSTDKDLFS